MAGEGWFRRLGLTVFLIGMDEGTGQTLMLLPLSGSRLALCARGWSVFTGLVRKGLERLRQIFLGIWRRGHGRRGGRPSHGSCVVHRADGTNGAGGYCKVRELSWARLVNR